MHEEPAADGIDAAYCLGLLRQLRDVSFATVDEGGLPTVRTIDVMMVEDGRLFFVAARGKDFYREVMRGRFVAIVGQAPDGRMCRLRGPVEHPSDPAEQHRLVDRVFELNPSMEQLYPGTTRYVLEAFYLQEGQGEFFDLGQSPLVRVPFSLGAAPPERRGFLVTDACIGCGSCAAACPRRCIVARDGGARFQILPEHCLHCGLCRETCPHDAIARL